MPKDMDIQVLVVVSDQTLETIASAIEWEEIPAGWNHNEYMALKARASEVFDRICCDKMVSFFDLLLIFGEIGRFYEANANSPLASNAIIHAGADLFHDIVMDLRVATFVSARMCQQCKRLKTSTLRSWLQSMRKYYNAMHESN